MTNAASLGGQLLLRLVVLGLTAVILGPAGQGSVVLAQLVATLGSGVGALGLEVALTRAFAVPETRAAARGVVILHAGAITVVIGAIVILGEILNDIGLTITCGLLALPGTLLLRLAAACALGGSRRDAFVTFTILPYATYAAAIIILAATGGLSVRSALISFVASMSIPALVLLPVIAKLTGLRFALPRRVGNVYAVGIRVFPGSMAQLANYRLDQLLVVAFLSRADLGLYSLAVAASEMTTLPGQAAANVLLPRATRRQEAKLALHRLLASLLVLIALSIPAFALLVNVGLESYSASLVPFILLAPGAFAVAATKVYAALIVAGGDAWGPSRVVILSVPLTLLAGLSLIPLLGIEGAALGSSVIYCTITIFLVRLRRRQLMRNPG